jgi:hypothetical protein
LCGQFHISHHSYINERRKGNQQKGEEKVNIRKIAKNLNNLNEFMEFYANKDDEFYLF